MPTDAKTQAGIRLVKKRGKELTKEDVKKIKPLITRYLKETGTKESELARDIRLSIRHTIETNSHLLIAKKIGTGEYVGLAEFEMLEEEKTKKKVLHNQKPKLYMDPLLVVVKKEYEGKGLGSRLMRGRLEAALKYEAEPLHATMGSHKGIDLVLKHEELSKKIIRMEKPEKLGKQLRKIEKSSKKKKKGRSRSLR